MKGCSSSKKTFLVKLAHPFMVYYSSIKKEDTNINLKWVVNKKKSK